jgi:hypothetical protein
MTEYIEEYMAEDLEAAYVRGCDEGREHCQEAYEKGWEEAQLEFQEDNEADKQQAHDDGFRKGRSCAQEEIRRLKLELKEFKPKQPRPKSGYIYFKSHPENQQAITEAAMVINEEKGKPMGKVKGASVVWQKLSVEEKETWIQRSIASFNGASMTQVKSSSERAGEILDACRVRDQAELASAIEERDALRERESLREAHHMTAGPQTNN